MNRLLSALIFIGLFTFISCNNQSRDNSKGGSEDLGAQNTDSLIHGYKFGMTREEFLDYSWELNRSEVVTNGSGAEIAEDVEWLKVPAQRFFYPIFLDEKIVQMPVSYSYTGWAPWNRSLFPDSLMLDLLPVFTEEYGARFDTLRTNDGGKVYVGIYGDTQIYVERQTHMKVMVTFTDLTKVENLNN